MRGVPQLNVTVTLYEDRITWHLRERIVRGKLTDWRLPARGEVSTADHPSQDLAVIAAFKQAVRELENEELRERLWHKKSS